MIVSDPLKILGKSKRWTPRRKSLVVKAIGKGDISFQEAIEGYGLTTEELLSWQHKFSVGGIRALQITRAQQHRPGVRPLRRNKRRRGLVQAR